MKRGDFSRVNKATAHDPKSFRIYLIISRQGLIENN